jgi:hypothetical protein
MPSLIEELRKQSVEQLFSVTSFAKSWNAEWRIQINQHLNSQITATDVLNLGDHLSQIFLSLRANSARSGTNSQSGASSAGAAWEALICWYLNICTIGTRVVAFKLRSMVPSAINDALTINYGTTVTNSESDLIILIFPNHSDFTTDISTNASLHIKERLVLSRLLSHFDYLASRHFNDFSLGVVQCKTNWNDIAQIPMLWDLVYRASGFISGSHISLGRNGFLLANLKSFSYSFVTVPTNPLSNYSPNKMQVKRVSQLSGGNYWGNPTRNGVAFSIKEIFTKNFQSGVINLRSNLTTELQNINSNYYYFNL